MYAFALYECSLLRKDQKSLGMGKTGKWKKVLVHTKIYYNTHLPLTTSYLEAIIRKKGDLTLKIKTLERWMGNMGEGGKGVLQGHLSFLGSAHYRLMVLHRNASTDFKKAPMRTTDPKVFTQKKAILLNFSVHPLWPPWKLGSLARFFLFSKGRQ